MKLEDKTVADAILFLASSRSDNLTGQTPSVSDGLTMAP